MRLGFDPWMGRHGNPLQSSCLENPMDRGAWWATVHRVSRVGRDWRLNMHAGRQGGEGNGTPLQYSCLENPMDGGACERFHFHFSLSCTGEGNGNPLQCSCLENPRDGGAWKAAIYGVTQSQTRLKRLSSSSRETRKRKDLSNLSWVNLRWKGTLPVSLHLGKTLTTQEMWRVWLCHSSRASHTNGIYSRAPLTSENLT